MNPPYSELLDADMKAFIAETEACYPVDTVSQVIENQRKTYNAMAARFRTPRPAGVAVNDAMIGTVPVRHYGSGRGHILYAHGGGFVVGDLDSHDDLCADIAERTGARVTAIDYRLCPEHAHPAALEDCLEVFDACSGSQPLVLAGDSAGGCLMAAVAAERRQHSIAGAVLIYPGLGGDASSGSYLTHAEAPMLTSADVRYYDRIRQIADDDATAKPLKSRNFSGLPPVTCFSADLDPLRDDAPAYVSRIVAAGGRARWVNGPGLVHGWLRARHRSNRAHVMFLEICDELRAFAQTG